MRVWLNLEQVAKIKNKQQQQIQENNQKNIQKLGQKLHRIELSSLIKEKSIEYEIQKRKQRQQQKTQQLQQNLSKIKEFYEEKYKLFKEKESVTAGSLSLITQFIFPGHQRVLSLRRFSPPPLPHIS